MVFDPPGTTGDVRERHDLRRRRQRSRVLRDVLQPDRRGGQALDHRGLHRHHVAGLHLRASNIPAWNFTMFQGRLVFTADAGSVTRPTGEELWTSGGTAASTHLVKDILPGADSPGIDGFVKAASNAGGRLFFRVFENTNVGYRLWKTDGTEIGTARRGRLPPLRCGSPRWEGSSTSSRTTLPLRASGDPTAPPRAPYRWPPSPPSGTSSRPVSGCTSSRTGPRPDCGQRRHRGRHDAGPRPHRFARRLTPFRGASPSVRRTRRGRMAATARRRAPWGRSTTRTLGSWPFGTSPPPSTGRASAVG